MSTPTVAADFLTLARKSGVLDEKKLLEHFPHPDDMPKDPHGCATALVRAGLLTPFQAQQLLTGKYRGFLLGAYKVLQPIGKGGMGAVFLGEHTGLKRKGVREAVAGAVPARGAGVGGAGPPEHRPPA